MMKLETSPIASKHTKYDTFILDLQPPPLAGKARYLRCIPTPAEQFDSQ